MTVNEITYFIYGACLVAKAYPLEGMIDNNIWFSDNSGLKVIEAGESKFEVHYIIPARDEYGRTTVDWKTDSFISFTNEEGLSVALDRMSDACFFW